MLKYLIVQICDSSVSYCHYENLKHSQRLIALEDLKAGIIFAMKENLMVQFVYPDKELPKEYKEIIETIDHNCIVSSSCEDRELVDKAEIVIFHDWTGLKYFNFSTGQSYVLCTKKEEFFDRYIILKDILQKVHRFNLVFTDIETFSDSDFVKYKKILSFLAEDIKRMYRNNNLVQFNLLTDRLKLPVMNNCNAGWETVTLAPDGCFYVCPAFYLESEECLGDVHKGLSIKNPQLYKLDYAPICRHCDAYQCKRCIWLNKKLTLEVNTPSHQQCVISHIERNTSRDIAMDDEVKKAVCDISDINEIDYLDPFDIRDKWDYELLQKELIKFHKENY